MNTSATLLSADNNDEFVPACCLIGGQICSVDIACCMLNNCVRGYCQEARRDGQALYWVTQQETHMRLQLVSANGVAQQWPLSDPVACLF